jgi:hypothetical protein
MEKKKKSNVSLKTENDNYFGTILFVVNVTNKERLEGVINIKS